MDSVCLTPKFRSFRFKPQNYCPAKAFFSANFSFFQFTHFKKHRPLSISSCYTTPSKPHKGQNSNSNGENHNFLSNPVRVSFPLLQTIRQLAALQTLKCVSSWRAYSDAQKVVDEFHGCYSQNGGLGVALLSVTANAKLRISPFVATLAANPTFVSALFAWIMAQSTKVFLNFLVERKWDLRLLFASGGMPSSHSALCAALSTSVALCHGVADSLFPVCLGFSLIVMYDAIGVRRHAGMQAEVLNMIVADLFKGHPVSERKLKELLGHTPSQVFAGAVLGIVVACFCCQVCTVAI